MITTTGTHRGTLDLNLIGGGLWTAVVAFRSASRIMSGLASRGCTDWRCFERLSARTEAPHTGHFGDAIGPTTPAGDIEVSAGLTTPAPSLE